MSADLVLIGGGNMGEALVRGLLGAGRQPGDVLVVEVSAARRAVLAQSFSGLQLSDQVDTLASASGVILAVKPPDIQAAAARAASAGARRLLSIAAGVATATIETATATIETATATIETATATIETATATIETATAGSPAVLRAMPNTAALLGAGATALCAGASAGPGDLDWAESVLSAVGLVVRLPESQFDAVTGLSGSGPAYLFLVAEAMVDAGVAAGLAREASVALVNQTFLGAGRLLAESDLSAPDLRAMVTSPGGTTAAGLSRLEAGAVRSAFMEAVAAAVVRSRQLA
jgi:pyrroline-5-carboxylate reductase